MERLFADLPFPADILDLAARSIRFPEDADLFFGRVSLAFHFLGPLQVPRLTFQMDQFS